ncbi:MULTISPECIES: Rnf-Nqr domain containing protein [unclassified Pseudomonas]|uniref:Rnf-Nqr domain containing protein n=1 Tax=unclassified Pseudomonas TaxID=196821 RepID=UPI000A1E34D3|nr:MULTISPECIES: Rnf-Nqr domain containing protein [unclassified Pseudomonas]
MNRTATLSNSLALTLLLGATGSLPGALATVLMCVVVVGLYGLAMQALRPRLPQASVLPAGLLVAATLAGCADTLVQYASVQWHQMIGLYAGLIGLQCIVLEHHGFFLRPAAARLKPFGLFAGLMAVMALLRELIGRGSIGARLSEHWQGLVLFGEGLHLFTLTAGAFILLGLLLALGQTLIRPTAPAKESHRP